MFDDSFAKKNVEKQNSFDDRAQKATVIQPQNIAEFA